MQFNSPLTSARLLRRYKRFLADVEFDDGRQATVHCPNTGAMTGLCEEGSRVWLSHSDSKTRKYAWTWELVETAAGVACIHSALANKVVGEALQANEVPELGPYARVSREVRVDDGNSRIDFVLSGPASCCYVEVKCVTLLRANGVGAFPDAVSARAVKHLHSLAGLSAGGHRTVLLFCVFHEGIQSAVPAADIDPLYAETLDSVQGAGVEVMVFSSKISVQGIQLANRLPFSLKT